MGQFSALPGTACRCERRNSPGRAAFDHLSNIVYNAKTRNQHRQRDIVDEFVREVSCKLEKEDMSYAQLAEKTDLSRQYIYKILNRHQNPTLTVASRIADALGLQITVSETA